MPHTIRENEVGLPTSDTIESRHLRRSVGQFVTGVTVVTYEVAGNPRGVTVNSFTSVSVDPPLILVSIARKRARPRA